MLAYVREHNLRASVTANYSSNLLLLEHTVYRDELDLDSRDPFSVQAKAESVDPENVIRTERLMDAISAAVPFLVKLKVDWGPMRPNLSGLVQPAPQLRKLSLVHRIFSVDDDVIEIPETLFAGKAPVLRRLRLKGFTLCSSTIPALESVHVLDFNTPRYLLDAPKTFPDVRHLTTGRSASHSNGTLSLLHSLVTSVRSDHADQNYFQALAVVPRVTVTCFVRGHEDQVPFSTLFAAFPVNTPLRLKLSHRLGDSFLVSVSTLNRHTVRACLFPLNPSSKLLAWIAEELEILRSRRLLELDVHHHLFGSLNSIFPNGIPDLRTLRVQRATITTQHIPFIAPMDPLVAVSPIRCPRLERYELMDPFGRPTSENLARELSATIQPGNGKFELVYNGAKILARRTGAGGG
ncbi:hypothetical protein EXIGLDRAFT_835656 [Exidia glandulosa HHB12029]|uniref:F-box domain-containing protein n=1 Tax=Exidia glandulosa HHB12029 TaxID=1314781 RepID=A0A165IJ17_EXIGL|nr:hypothetical protein EXIGLDRAFT_835656 [Exidia glandulosa HHB12029]